MTFAVTQRGKKMYESPLDITLTPVNTIAEEIRDGIDGRVMKEIITATRGVNINVNKDELIKALNYDRNQYEKGYADAKASIIHCRDCKWRSVYQFPPKYDKRDYCDKHEKTVNADGFCSWAERREE